MTKLLISVGAFNNINKRSFNINFFYRSKVHLNYNSRSNNNETQQKVTYYLKIEIETMVITSKWKAQVFLFIEILYQQNDTMHIYTWAALVQSYYTVNVSISSFSLHIISTWQTKFELTTMGHACLHYCSAHENKQQKLLLSSSACLVFILLLDKLFIAKH